MYSELSKETNEFFRFMTDNELFDVLAKKGKAIGGYCITMRDFKTPFIFANFNGTSGDIDVLTHEAGHAFAAYLAKDAEIMQLTEPTMESCEIHSMSMEFFTYPWMELFFRKDVEKYRFSHLSEALEFLPYGCEVDEFQHLIYENPDMTMGERRALWLNLEKKYRPEMDFGDIPFMNEGGIWQRQLHIYILPFYYIDYCLAQVVAMQFWKWRQENPDAAWKAYFELCSKAGTKTYVELVKEAGLVIPFGEGSVDGIAEACSRYLDSVNDSAF
jgi:M3 family oligoendopeptidase